MSESEPTVDCEVAEVTEASLPDPRTLVELIEVLRKVPIGHRVPSVEAALTYLNTPWTAGGSTGRLSAVSDSSVPALTAGDTELARRAQIWLSQNNLKIGDLASVFHGTGSGYELIVHQLPGTTNKERVQHCYVLCGVRALLNTGEPRFADEEARRVCRDLGCYDSTNHAYYVKAVGNLMVGSKSTGFELTQPGLRAAAALARAMTTATD